MTEYHLWLDESGEFLKDNEKKKKNFRPSLIGGILFEKDKFSKYDATKIIKSDYFHSTECSENTDVFNKFKAIAESDVNLIEISNEECINIIDSNLTYQNIMAEGLMQIIKKLKSEHPDNIKLNVLIAERGDCTNEYKSNKKVSPEQYNNKLQERILLEGYRHQISPELYNIQVKNAKQELRLMIADIICNSFLTRDTKFKGEMGEYINNVHDNPDKTWTFTVFENSVSNQVNNYLVEKRLGEAVFYLCQSENTSFVNEKMKVISSYVSVASQLEVKLQTDIIASLLSYYIAVSSNFTSCINLLDNLLTFWIPELEKFYGDRNKQLSDNVKRDYLFYKDTVYTHTGDIEKSYECEELCDKLIDNMSLNWDNIAYRMKYENRKLITKMNAFDFEKAANECSSLINKCRGIKEALELVQDSENDGHFEELAKALGTRTQLYMFQIRSDINNYNLAVADSNEAIAEFEGDIDKKRQYSYRVQIETEKGNYDEALKYIFMQNGLSIEEKQLKDVIEKLDKDIFALYSYVRLMSEGSLNNWNKSEDMYEALIKRNYINELIEKDEKFHPRGLILWKFATYLMHHNMIKSAFDKYDTAVSYLFDTEDITTNFIGIAVLLERYAYALKNKKAAKENLKSYLRDLKKNYDNLYKRNMPESMKNIFTDIDFEKDDWNYYFQLSRRITY